MILGNIIGKVSTSNFRFLVTGDAKKFDYVQIPHKEHDYVLGQIIELESEGDTTVAICNIIGYKDDEGKLRQIMTPFIPKTEVLKADDEFIKKILAMMDVKNSAYIGFLEGKEIPVFLDLKKLLTKHLAILAKTGAGKSYAGGVLVEEILKKNVPILIIDPHGEYSSLRQPNLEKEELKKFNLAPENFSKQVQEYGDVNLNLKPLKINEEFTVQELMNVLPSKLTSNQQSYLYSIIKQVSPLTLSNLVDYLEHEQSMLKFNLMNVLDYITNLNVFSPSFTPYNELIKPGKCTIINLKGVAPETQQIIVYKLMNDLFEQRKKDKIAPFFTIIEEAHNFIPEKTFGDSRSSSIIRTIASEGRKFGLGLAIITQRPARVEKNVLSQCNTQIILKVTNPNDLKAITGSVEGLIGETENQIKNLSIGTAMVTGITEVPLFVAVRPRQTKHGGEAVDILDYEEKDISDELEKFKEKDLLPLIRSKVTVKDLRLMSEKKNVKTYLIPAVMFRCSKQGTEFNLLVDSVRGDIIVDIQSSNAAKIDKDVSLIDKQSYEKVEYGKAVFDVKMEPKISAEKLKKKIEDIADVADMQECFIEFHSSED